MSAGVIILPVLQELEEFLSTSLLEKTHQRALDGLHLSAGNFGDLAITIDIASCDLLEFEVTGYIGVDKDLGKLS